MSIERGSSGWKLRPDLSTLTWQDELRLAQSRISERGLRLREAELLRAALDAPLDGEWEQHIGNADRVALGGLLKSGLVIRHSGRIEPSEPVRHSLAHILVERPSPVENRPRPRPQPRTRIRR